MNTRRTAAEIIAALSLEPLPNEGGFFRRTYTSNSCLPNGRAAGSAIYFLLTPEGFSALHLLRTDELWHVYAGDPAEHIMLDPASGNGIRTQLGPDICGGQQVQLTVPGNVWQGARLAPGSEWTLLGCTLSPGWDEREFVLGERAELTAQFPEWVKDICKLTR